MEEVIALLVILIEKVYQHVIRILVRDVLDEERGEIVLQVVKVDGDAFGLALGRWLFVLVGFGLFDGVVLLEGPPVLYGYVALGIGLVRGDGLHGLLKFGVKGVQIDSLLVELLNEPPRVQTPPLITGLILRGNHLLRKSTITVRIVAIHLIVPLLNVERMVQRVDHTGVIGLLREELQRCLRVRAVVE